MQFKLVSTPVICFSFIDSNVKTSKFAECWYFIIFSQFEGIFCHLILNTGTINAKIIINIAIIFTTMKNTKAYKETIV